MTQTNKPLSPQMNTCYGEALRVGSIGAGWRTGTVVALMNRGLLREYNPHTGRHYLATDRDAIHATALLENLDRSHAQGLLLPHLDSEEWARLTMEWREILSA